MSALGDAILTLGPTRTPGGMWRSEAGPLLAAACLHATETPRGSALPGMAVNGFHRMIGSYAGPGGDYAGPDGLVTAMFFACHLGHAQQVLRTTSNLSPAEVTLWTTTVVGIAQRLVDNGELRWYANGNITLGNALVMALAWKATGDPAWLARYEAALEHALRPSPARWPGRGQMLDTPDWRDIGGTDQAGYLTEEGPGPPGFDTDYTMLQASQVARLYLLTRDWKALRLAHVLWGKLAPLTDAAATIDMSVGTRHPRPGARWDFTSPVAAVLADRADVQPIADAYWRKLLDPARWPPTMNATGYYGIGTDLGTALLARAGWRPRI